VINEYFSIPKNQWLDIQDEIAELKAQLETCQTQQQAAVEAARAAEQEQCCKNIVEAMAQEREQCCRDMCDMCNYRWTRIVVGTEYKHIIPWDGNELGCKAHAIRQRAAQEQQEQAE
jgi:hypothetical protein